MKTEIITCDLCGYTFNNQESWESRPASATLQLQSPPRQSYESRHYDHLCRSCINALIDAWQRTVDTRKKQTDGDADVVFLTDKG